MLIQLTQRPRPPGVRIIKNAAHRGRSRAAHRVIRGLKLRPHGIVKIKPSNPRHSVVRGENGYHNANPLHDEREIIAQELRERPHLAVQAHLLQLRAAVKLKRMLEHARHLPRGRGDAGDGHERMPVDLDHLVRAVEHHGVARSRPAIPGHEHAAGKLEGEDGGGVGLLRRMGAGRRRPADAGRGIEPLAAQKRREIRGLRGSGVETCRLRTDHPLDHSPVRWR